jgi:hypothetical protein
MYVFAMDVQEISYTIQKSRDIGGAYGAMESKMVNRYHIRGEKWQVSPFESIHFGVIFSRRRLLLRQLSSLML